eukprot:TRINITY_DN22606_c0_g1_i1.p1 TRINITY_DN22606_c0_g1~~TRINITY_DN22606_c0_g1_i1.p1  ORF type:complete len:205 (-),score=33.29 TRINITY_DN22606_c0_g1_i1:203-817(-)
MEPAPIVTAEPKTKGLKAKNSKQLTAYMRRINVLNGSGNLIVALLATFSTIVSISIAKFIMGAYAILFSALFVLTELHLRNLEHRIKNYFGFMFSYIGRGFYMLFLASMMLAMMNVLCYIFAAITFVNCLFNFYIMKTHPVFTSGELSLTDNPYASYTAGEEDMRAYLRAHPQIAKKVVTTSVNLAKNNPEIAKSAIESQNPFK